MKKIIFLLTILSFASIATAENEAVYDAETGIVKIPVVSIKGQSEKFSAILQQQDGENLTFKLTDSKPETLSDSFIEATYDSETGTVIIPTLIVLEKEGASAQHYSVELQETGEKIFEVTKIQDKAGQPINNFKEMTSSNSGVLSKSRPNRDELPDYYNGGEHWIRYWCTGTPSQNVYSARKKFQNSCGIKWDYRYHVCDYKTDGYHCNGVVYIAIDIYGVEETGP